MSKNKDKRSVSTDALETLGNIIDESAGGRDAIHIAVERVTASHRLAPGQDVGIRKVDGVTYAGWTDYDKMVGIVDPFIKGSIEQGRQFWLLVYPRQVTSLRHVWSHPAFEEAEEEATPAIDVVGEFIKEVDTEDNEKAAAEEWIRNYAADLDVGYHDLMSSAQQWIDNDDYMVRGGLLEGEWTSDEFWEKYEIMTEESGSGSFFTCSC